MSDAINLTAKPLSNQSSKWFGLDKAGIVTATFLLTALLLGGGGSRFPMSEMIIYISAMPALYFALMAHHDDNPVMRSMILLIAATIGLIILQIIPLPTVIWQMLPGRATLAEISALVDGDNMWRPWSIDPSRTIYSALYLIAPITGFLAVSRLSVEHQKLLLWLILIASAFHLIIAFMQAASGGDNFYLYNTTHKGLPIGLFANRNHTAILLLIGLIIAAPLICREPSKASIGKLMIYWGAALILSVGILATSSRAVTVLLLITLVVMAMMSTPKAHRKLGFISIALTSLVGGAIIMAMAASGKLGSLSSLAERFQQSDDHRYEFWPDTINTASHFFPFGSGLGTFDSAFRSQESLAIVGSHFVNHAHNDYIEILIELGVFGLILLFFLFKIIGVQALQILKGYKKGKISAVPLYALGALGAVCLHSLIDYPARSLAIASVCGALLSIVINAKQHANYKGDV